MFGKYVAALSQKNDQYEHLAIEIKKSMRGGGYSIKWILKFLCIFPHKLRSKNGQERPNSRDFLFCWSEYTRWEKFTKHYYIIEHCIRLRYSIYLFCRITPLMHV